MHARRIEEEEPAGVSGMDMSSKKKSLGGTSPLNGYQSSCPRRDGEKNNNIVFMCVLL